MALAAGTGGVGASRLLSAAETGGSALGARSMDAGGAAVIGAGTAPAVPAGPFHTVQGSFDYGGGGAGFGDSRGGRPHEGQDVFAKPGTPLVAVRSGVVVEAAGESSSLSGGRGNYIAIYSPAERRTYVYLHMSDPSPFQRGDRVRAGDVVGAVGCTGSCYGDHLHFEVRLGRGTAAKPIDPLPLLRRWPQAP